VAAGDRFDAVVLAHQGDAGRDLTRLISTLPNPHLTAC